MFLQALNIVKQFGSRTVLDDVSLHVDKGEMLCILGPSGCGKTTLLRIIAGLEKADGGELMMEGVSMLALPPELRHCGFVFQNYALFPNLDVSKNIAYGLHSRQWNTAQKKLRVTELLELAGLSAHAGHYPHQLSGGQQQRVALVRALAPKPRMLLLDEPLSALDAQVRSQLREDVRKIQQQLGITAILVTHDQQEALAMADRIVIMHEGRIEQSDTPEALYRKPATRFVAEFVGVMNIVPLPLPHPAAEKTADSSGGPCRVFGIRYEDVGVHEATEARLKEPNTFVARVESNRLFGSFRRLELLLGDHATIVYADIPSGHTSGSPFAAHSLVAVTLPQAAWCVWEKA